MKHLNKRYVSRFGDGFQIDTDFGQQLLEICDQYKDDPSKGLIKIRSKLLYKQKGMVIVPQGAFTASDKTIITNQVKDFLPTLPKNKKIIPDKTDWDSFLVFKKWKTEGYNDNQAYSMVLHDFNHDKWRSLISEHCNATIPEDPTDSFPYVEEGVLQLIRENNMSGIKPVKNVEKFVKWLLPQRSEQKKPKNFYSE